MARPGMDAIFRESGRSRLGRGGKAAITNGVVAAGLTTRLTYQSDLAVVVFAVLSGNLWVSVAAMGV